MTDLQPANSGVIAVVDDMFFAAKIKGAAEAAGRRVEFIKSLEQLTDYTGATPSVVIVDLNSSRVDPFELIRIVKSDSALRSVPTIGFLSHVQVELKKKASEAGCDLVMPRSVFAQQLGEIVSGRFDVGS